MMALRSWRVFVLVCGCVSVRACLHAHPPHATCSPMLSTPHTASVAPSASSSTPLHPTLQMPYEEGLALYELGLNIKADAEASRLLQQALVKFQSVHATYDVSRCTVSLLSRETGTPPISTQIWRPARKTRITLWTSAKADVPEVCISPGKIGEADPSLTRIDADERTIARPPAYPLIDLPSNAPDGSHAKAPNEGEGERRVLIESGPAISSTTCHAPGASPEAMEMGRRQRTDPEAGEDEEVGLRNRTAPPKVDS